MTDTETCCKDLLGETAEEKRFTFDFSFQSAEGFLTREDGYTYAAPGSDYKDQQYVFDKIGQSVLD